MRSTRRAELRPIEHAFTAQGVVKRYGSTEALVGVDLEVAPGEVVGLLGPNGAGKSTLTKIGCGLVRPAAGVVRVCGDPPATRRARRSLGYLAEGFRFPAWLRAVEVLELHQQLAGSDGGGPERARLLERVGLADSGQTQIEAMSKGMAQRLGIAQALVGDPQMLFLDEPASALDPVGRREVRALLEELRRRGVGVLLSSHLLSEVELVCDRVAILRAGAVVAAGRTEDLTRSRGVEIDTTAGTRRYPDAAHEAVPGIVAELVAAGHGIYEVRATRSPLEDVYVEAMGGPAG